ncbi:MAG TPA: MFS transporter [Beutenbergiaceae bacterium]|nr:MFS transporter [Beutenbergiaceae bacterium]
MARVSPSVPGLAAAMAVAMGAGPLIVYAISALSPFLVPAMDLSRTQYGSLATLTFAAAALSSIWAGRIVDTTGARQVMFWLVTGATGAMLAAAFAPNYPVLVLAVLASGVIQALSNPVTNRLAATWVPPGPRGIVMGVKQSGVQMIQATTGLLLPTVAVAAGWRGAMAIAGGACLLLGVSLAAKFVPAERVVHRSTSAVTGARLPAPVWWLTGFIFMTGAAMQGANFYLPLFGYEELDLPVSTAGLLAAVVGTTGIAARIAWGRVAERLGGRVAMPALALGGAGAVALILTSLMLHPALVWVGAFLLGATGVAANVVVMVSVIHVVPSHAIGRASGVVALGMYLGFTAGPVSVGAVVDVVGDYSAAWTALAVIYLLGLVAAAGYARQTRRP